jgi:hypothetical protein
MLLQFIINHINSDYESQRDERGIFSNQVRKFLIIIDNAESLIEHDSKEFKDMLAKILNECQNLSVILTSRRGLNSLQNCSPGKILFLEKLSLQDSVEVFLNQTTSL